MKILSNFKDYYDYLAFQYGVDDQIVFHRHRVIPVMRDIGNIRLPSCQSVNEDMYAIPENEPYEHHLGSTNRFYYEYGDKICQFEGVSIVGFLYYYLYEYDRSRKSAIMRIPKKEDYVNYDTWRRKNHQEIGYRFIWMGIESGSVRPSFKKLGVIPPEYNEYVYDIDRRLHKKLGVPVLWKQLAESDGSRSLVMPNLSKIIGFSGLYPAERIYRDIYNFLQAQRRTPDSDPPVAVGNDSKIIKHGFDLKQSFRHPVTSRQLRRQKKNDAV